MKIAILSKQDAAGGGASRVAEILTLSLNKAGHEAVLFTIRHHPPASHIRPIYPELLRKPLAFFSAGCEVVTGHVPLPFDWLFLRKKLQGFDLVHIHDHWTAFNPWTLRWISKRYATFWTLHDCSSFTGGCLYMHGCERHRDNCGNCPRKKEGKTLMRLADFTTLSLNVKRRAYAGCAFHLAAPSRWIARKALESGVFKGPVEIIKNARDLDVFTPELRPAARANLGLAENETVVLLSATSLRDSRKGALLGVEAINGAISRGVRLRVLLMGHGAANVKALLHCDSIDLGYVATQEAAAAAYAAADAFVFPSRADNYPLSIQESMGCGTPVVAFAVGGVPEMINHGITGFLVLDGDAKSLTDHLVRLLSDDPLRASMRVACRAHALAEWSMDRFTQESLAHYRRILAQNHAQL